MFSKDVLIFLNSFLFKNGTIDFLVDFFANEFGYILFFATFVYFLFVKKKLGKFIWIIFIVGLSWFLSLILKKIFGSPRPFFVVPEIRPLFVLGGTDSFPSGHATVFGSLATAVYLEDPKLGYLFIFSALIIGLARIMAGVHYPHDILAGFAIGSFFVVFGGEFTKKLRNKRAKK